MSPRRIAEELRNQHCKCCLTTSYQDHGCKIDVQGLDKSELATIHGDKHQEHHGTTGKLCDRLIFGEGDENFVCSVELKGGNNVKVSDAILQIQGGLDLAKTLLNSRLDWSWYALLAYSGSMSGKGTQLLRTKTVSFGGKRRLVDRVDCGFSLLSYLSDGTSNG